MLLMKRSKLFVQLFTQVCFLMGIFLSQPMLALETDRDQPVEIEADSAEFSESEGLTVYSGNVRLVQGSIELLADEIQLRTLDSQIVELVALGSPAQYEQLPELGADKLIARSDTIRYLLEEDIIELSGSASFSQQGATLSGGTILYDIREQKLIANSGPDGPVTTEVERVRVVLPPLGSELP